MPRYYFHITNRQQSIENPKGMDLPGNAAARQEAVVLAGELRHGKVMPGRSWQGWFVSVVDQHEHEVVASARPHASYAQTERLEHVAATLALIRLSHIIRCA